jgi:hypothetical protein
MRGGCACGRVQYTGTAYPDKMSYCYCFTCRKVGGGPFLAFVRVPTKSIHWLSTSPDIWKRSDVAERGFCSKCGSTLSMQYYFQVEHTSLTASSIDESRLLLPEVSEHIFVKEKAPWHKIPEDGIGRFDGSTPGFVVRMDSWAKGRSTTP